MIKTVTQYVAVCDNAFCDNTLRTIVDHHSDERREKFEEKLKERGWGGISTNSMNGNSKHLCPSCMAFSLEILNK